MRDDELLHRFLLGELAEDEAESLERRLLQEDALFDLCEAIEGDLLAASARGELTPADNERVLTRLAASPGGRARLALARDLAHVPQEAPGEVVVPAPLPFRRPPAPPSWPAARWAALAASLFFFAVGGSWMVNHLLQTMPPDSPVDSAIRTGQSTAQRTEPPLAPTRPAGPETRPTEPSAPPEPEPAPERPVPEPAPKPQPAVLQLTLDTQRGGEPAEELRQLAVPEGTEEVQIQVSLGGAEQDYAAFNASVRSSAAGEVWSRQGLLPQALDWGAALILGIPAEKLPDGRYEMEVQGVSVGGEAETIGVQEFEIVAD